ncbi:HAD family hydrolase [Thermocoleostomius sinensis A174]|uniref:HAD family hydrolase n=2 Tax=Thermocoleostomius TaxID=3065395 RepID=A0A9E8ZCX3_9CYAN|nr:HAD family hydrolase [Thermocoleostomius sinensis A174]
MHSSSSAECSTADSLDTDSLQMTQQDAGFSDYPHVIFLDAVGTLFGVKGSVGDAYSTIARRFDVTADPTALNQAFFQTFKSATPMAFPETATAEIPQREYNWWYHIAYQTFAHVGAIDQFQDFPGFFATLYDYFATAEPWFVYPDVWPALTYWREQGISLGVLSNFDTRLYSVLRGLELEPFFSSITISTEVGAAKPDSQVFQAALNKHNCLPEQAWHIGDSVREDYEGAKAAGLRAIWLKR